MTDERTIAAILSVSISAAIAIGSALIQRGRREERFESLEKDVAKHGDAIRECEKTLQEKVSLALFREEIAELHSRISRTQREQAAAIEKLDAKIDSLTREVTFINGILSSVPNRLEDIIHALKK
jgi:uncharacterized coiled-coil protein SlyX